MINKELEWTGERLVTTIKNYGAIEHLHRYAFASEFVYNKIVADIASGEGYGSNILSLKAQMVYGVDISKEAIIHAKKKYKNRKLKFIVGSVDKNPLKSSSIDVIVSFETLEHVINQENMLLDIKRALKKEGILIMSTPEKSNYQDKQVEKNHFHIKELYFNDFKILIEKHFKNILFFKQKFLSGSFIVPFEKSNNFKNYSGDYDNIVKSNTIEDQTFNICIASDEPISCQESSFFDLGSFQSNICIKYEEASNHILASKTYKLAKMLTLPFRIIRKIMK